MSTAYYRDTKILKTKEGYIVLFAGQQRLVFGTLEAATDAIDAR